jgi:hypothetical protein
MGHRSRIGALAAMLTWGILLRAEPAQQCQPSNLPSNMELSPTVSRILEALYMQSPTFRGQCERIASTKTLRVIVRLDSAMRTNCRAFTTFRRSGREIRADVHLPPSPAIVELAAHEFEHVLEQIDGLNLRRLARISGTGVREIDRELFETDRAQRVGRAVATEAMRESRAPLAD